MRVKPPVRQASYDTYVRKYYEKRAELRRKLKDNSVEMKEKLLTESQFRERYDAIKNDMIAEGKKPANITRQLVNYQAYEVTYKQAIAARKAFKQIGTPHKLLEIYTGRVPIDDLYELSKIRYDELREQGLSGKEASILISNEIWGS